MLPEMRRQASAHYGCSRTTIAISWTTSPGAIRWRCSWSGGFRSSFGPASTRSPSCCRSFPKLVVVTGSQGSNPLDRYAWPLIEKYPNLIFETSGYLVDGGIEEFCRRYSASRLSFRFRVSRQRRGCGDAVPWHRRKSPTPERQAIAWRQLESTSGGGQPANEPLPDRAGVSREGAFRRLAPSSTCTGTWARSTAVICHRRRWSACATGSSAAACGGSSARTIRPWPATSSAATL